VGRHSSTQAGNFDAQKDANLMIGCRVQQTCERLVGVNRRGGEEPRGRNVTGRSWATDCGWPKPHLGVVGVDDEAGDRWRGTVTDHENGRVPSLPVRKRPLWPGPMSEHMNSSSVMMSDQPLGSPRGTLAY